MRRTANSRGASAAAVLQKASMQLKGGRVFSTIASGADVEDDGLGDYLRMLNQKPSTSEMQWDKFGELSDVFADDGASMLQVKSTSTTSKFLKKSSDKQPTTVNTKPTQKPHSTGKTVSQNSTCAAALEKARSYTQRAKGEGFMKAAGKSSTVLSDSDLELSLSPDEDVLADISADKRTATPATQTGVSSGKVKPSPVKTFQSVNVGTHASKSSPFHAVPLSKQKDSDDDVSRSSSIDIGKGGSKFLKKREPSVTGIPEVRSAAKSKSGRQQVVKHLQSRSYESMFDSDDESIARVVGDTMRNDFAVTHSLHSNKSKENERDTSSHVQPVDDDDDDDVTSIHVDETSSEVESDNFHFNVKVLDALDSETELKPVISQYQTVKRTSSDNRTQHGEWSVLAKLGVHTVDDLADSPVDRQLAGYDSDFESVSMSGSSRVASPAAVLVPPLRSILSITPRSLTPKSSRSRVRLMDDLNEVRSRSPSPVSTARSTDVPDEDLDTTRSAASVQTRDDDDRSLSSTSEHTARAVTDSDASSVRSDCRWSRRSFRSGRRSSEPLSSGTGRSRFSGHRSSRRSSESSRRMSDVSYTEDFTSELTAADTAESSRTSMTDDTEVEVHRHTAGGGGGGHSDTRVNKSHRTRSRLRDYGVQTGVDVGLYYSWPVTSQRLDDVTAAAEYRQAFTDPASVATAAVSADTLQAMTSYTPASVALNDLLRQQVEMTRQFISVQCRLHQQLVNSVMRDSATPYHYTTLADTKQFIRRHRRPVVTFEDALRQVKENMGVA